MDISRSGHFGSLLAGSLLCLVMVVCMIQVAQAAIRLLRVPRVTGSVAPREPVYWPAVLKHGVGVLVLGALGAGCLLIAISGLVHYLPAAGNLHPWITAGLRAMGNPQRTLEGLERGLDEGDAALVRLALGMGAHPDQVSPPPALLRSRDPTIRQLLLDHGASPDGAPGQQAPLRGAAEAGDLQDFRWLLDHGSRRGLTASSAEPQPVQHELALQGADIAWLEALLEAGLDLRATDAGGANLLDVLLLKRPQSNWLPRLRAAGATPGLPLQAPELPTSHAAAAAALQWWQSDRSVPGNRAYTPDESAIRDLPHRPPELRSVRGNGSEALVWVDLGADIGQGLVLRLQGRDAEATSAAEAAPAAEESGSRVWKVVGVWLQPAAP